MKTKQENIDKLWKIFLIAKKAKIQDLKHQEVIFRNSIEDYKNGRQDFDQLYNIMSESIKLNR